jgi:hypothetical protein
MTERPLEPRPANVLVSRRAKRTGSRALRALTALVFVACATTDEDFFDPSMTTDPLVALPGAAGTGGAAAISNPPPPVAAAGSSSTAGSGGSGATTPPPVSGPDAGSNGPGQQEGDAAVPPPPTPPAVSDGSCGQQCETSGGLCSQGTCFFDCQAPGSCNQRQILCPPGVPCDVTCGDNSCTDNVLCNADGNCTVRCAGQRSCRQEVICEGICDVTCSGVRSCEGGIGGPAQLLDLKCTGTDSCGSTTQCEGQDCRVSCSGADSCQRVRIFAQRNTLVCSGQGACDDDVSCNGASCNVQCAADACGDDVDCDALSCTINRLDAAGG